MERIKPTLNVLQVYLALLNNPEGQHYALELSKDAGISIGSIYAIVAKMERVGILTSEVESITPQLAGRPPRRYYTLTPAGIEIARTETQDARQRFATQGLAHA